MQTAPNLPTQPLITFIITTYNLPVEMLRECLTSITSLSLSLDQREIIIIDDGSDNAFINELIETDNDIIYMRQPHHGISAARNMGLKIATGKFIQFVDGDDCLVQAQYEHCLDIIRYQEPVDMVMFHATQSKDQPLDTTFEGPMTGTHYMETHNLRGSACGYIFRADRLGSLRFTNKLLHEDEEFTPQLLLRVHNLYTTHAKAYFYRKRSGSITRNKSEEVKDKRLQDSLSIILHLQALANNSGDTDERNALERRVAQLSMDYLVNVIRLTRSHKRFAEAISSLADNNLYPLPDNRYTWKYTIFCRMLKSKIGRTALLTIL